MDSLGIAVVIFYASAFLLFALTSLIGWHQRVLRKDVDERIGLANLSKRQYWRRVMVRSERFGALADPFPIAQSGGYLVAHEDVIELHLARPVNGQDQFRENRSALDISWASDQRRVFNANQSRGWLRVSGLGGTPIQILSGHGTWDLARQIAPATALPVLEPQRLSHRVSWAPLLFCLLSLPIMMGLVYLMLLVCNLCHGDIAYTFSALHAASLLVGVLVGVRVFRRGVSASMAYLTGAAATLLVATVGLTPIPADPMDWGKLMVQVAGDSAPAAPLAQGE